MTSTEIQEPEGTTLNVYSYVVKRGKPVGPREVMRGANLSSPSVTYWHLQTRKYGTTGKKWRRRIRGQRKNKHQRTNLDWTKPSSKTDVPFPFFLGILIVESIIVSVQFYYTGQIPNIALLYLIPTNRIAFALISHGRHIATQKKLT